MSHTQLTHVDFHFDVIEMRNLPFLSNAKYLIKILNCLIALLISDQIQIIIIFYLKIQLEFKFEYIIYPKTKKNK